MSPITVTAAAATAAAGYATRSTETAWAAETLNTATTTAAMVVTVAPTRPMILTVSCADLPSPSLSASATCCAVYPASRSARAASSSLRPKTAFTCVSVSLAEKPALRSTTAASRALNPRDTSPPAAVAADAVETDVNVHATASPASRSMVARRVPSFTVVPPSASVQVRRTSANPVTDLWVTVYEPTGTPVTVRVAGRDVEGDPSSTVAPSGEEALSVTGVLVSGAVSTPSWIVPVEVAAGAAAVRGPARNAAEREDGRPDEAAGHAAQLRANSRQQL